MSYLCINGPAIGRRVVAGRPFLVALPKGGFAVYHLHRVVDDEGQTMTRVWWTADG